MRKHFTWVIVAAVAIILLIAAPTILQFIVLFTIPWNCDEGMAEDRRAANVRGDVVAEYAKACTGVGTVVDYSVVLQAQGTEKITTLVKHSELSYGYPKFRWIDDDTLVIDLGEARSVWSQVDKIGSIQIAYSYTKTETGWW
jgi:hypothetical protein